MAALALQSKLILWVVYRSFYGRRGIAWLLKLQKRLHFAAGAGTLTVEE
ncbi:hypothetical protein PF003_g26675 [Phytophthora fragariae]|nr:hypothetical protein PF003_g26675 [Phytophthora fragariae]